MSTGTPPARRGTSRLLVLLTVGLVALWATGLGPRPAGLLWDRVYDVGLFNAPWLTAAATAWCAARRTPGERVAWRSLAAALVLLAGANAVRTLAVGATGMGTAPALADTLAVLGYPLVWVTIVGLIRARVARFHPSMWLDGLVGALGTAAGGTAFLIGPYLSPPLGRGSVPAGRHPLPPAIGRGSVQAVDISWPAGDVLLLALLVAVGAIVGVRRDRALVAIAAALACVALGDVQQFVRSADGSYTDGGPLDFAWLAGT